METRLIVQFGQHRTAEHMVVGTDSVNGHYNPTQSVPARVERANWNGEHTSSTSLMNCRPTVKEVLVAIPRIPPSGFINAVMVA